MKQLSLPLPLLPLEEESYQEELNDDFEEILDDDERQKYLDFKKEEKDVTNHDDSFNGSSSKQFYHNPIPLL